MRIVQAILLLPVLLVAGCSGAVEAPIPSDSDPALLDASPAAEPSSVPPPRSEMQESRQGFSRVVGGATATVATLSGKEGGLGGPGVIGPITPQQTGAAASAMIIRTGQASIEVDSLEPAVANIQALALQVGGYVANIGMHTGRSQLRQATLEMKIPAARFDAALEALQPIGKLERLEVAAQDVGEEYADVAARVANARRLEERLLSLLATRTGRLDDVLAAERELARVREEIERYEGRMRYLQARVTLSTLHVTVHEPAPILARTARNPIVEAFRGAWRNFVVLIAGLIELSGFVIPLAAIGLFGWLVWRRWGPTVRSAGEGMV